MVKKLYLILLLIYLSFSLSGCIPFIKSYRSYKALQDGRTYAKKRHYERAKVYFEKALEHNPRNINAWISLGNLYFTIEDYESSRYAYQTALQYDKEAYNAYSGLWMVRLEESGYKDDVREEIKREIEDFLSSGRKTPERLMAAYYGQHFLHDNKEAIVLSEEIMSLRPDDEIISTLANESFEDMLIEKDVEKRLNKIEVFQTLFPMSKERTMAYALRLKLCAKDLKNTELLYEYGEDWIMHDPDNRMANFYVGYFYTDADIHLDKAVLYLKKALTLIEDPDPDDKPEYYPESEWYEDLKITRGIYYDTLGWAYYKSMRYTEAEWAYKKATKYLSFNSKLYYHLGLLLEIKDDIGGAINSYVQSLKSGENKESEERLKELFDNYYRNHRDEEPLNNFFANREGVTTFTEVTEAAGLSSVKATRLSWGDFNNDGFEDILFNGARLFNNNGNGTFIDKTKDAGITEISGANGGVWGDIDNDGDLDFYTFASGKGTTDMLWENKGDGTFNNITMTALKEPEVYPTEAAAWGDYDNDGFIDLYIANYEKPLLSTVERAICLEDHLLHNNGDNTFSEVNSIAGVISLENMCGRGVNWGDYNNDGNPDIYVANYRLDPNFLWRNNGNGTFTNVAEETGVEGHEEEGYYGHSIGAEWGDYDNDGDLDLFVSNLAHPRYIGLSDKSMLLENLGPPDFIFKDRFKGSGIRFEETSADPSLIDYDNDGILDLYFTSTYKEEISFLYKGIGDGTFTDVTWLVGVRVGNGWGNAFADYDRDGDIDLLVASSDGVRLFRNDGNNHHWIHLKVIGGESNHPGIGTRVTVVPSENDKTLSPFINKQIREVQGGKGSGSQHSLTTEFGLGIYDGTIDIEARFPSGKIKTLENVKTNQLIIIEE